MGNFLKAGTNSYTSLHLRSRLSICYVAVAAQSSGDTMWEGNFGPCHARIYSLMEEVDTKEKIIKINF